MSLATAASTQYLPQTLAAARNGGHREAGPKTPAALCMPAFSGLKASGSSLQMKRIANESLFKKVAPLNSRTGKKSATRAVATCEGGMNIIFVSAEVAPWSKTGGLGDVVGGLPPALAARGHRVMTISPRYDQYKDAWDTDTTVDVKVGNKIETVRFFHCFKRGVDRVFIDHPLFLAKVWGKTGSKIYGPKSGTDFEDNQLRFSLFNQAALEAPRVLNLNSSPDFSGPYGEEVVFVANDWHTSLIPCYLKYVLQPQGIYRNAKVAFCIHNIAYQGRFAPSDFSYLNLPESARPSFDFTDGYVKPVQGKKINWLKAGFVEADKVFTVSPTYAQELVSGPAKGVELDTVVAKTGVTGIINGMDVQEWDPAADKYLDVPYTAETATAGKAAAKEALQAEVGLPIDPNVPVLAFIGRLEEQKGSDILEQALPSILEEDVQIVVLGTGKKYLEEQLETLEVKFPTKARGVVKFNVPLAHMMTAGADFMLVPSRFEPCGLIQLHAMRYGTVPIVASTGGLVDTVKDGETGFHVGEFNVDCDEVDPKDVAALTAAVKRAVTVFKTSKYPQMVQNCLALDLSWKEPARKWEQQLLAMGGPGKAGTEGDEIGPKAKENIATP